MGAIKNTYKNTIVHDTSQLTIHTVNSMRPVLSRVMVKLVTTVTDPLLIRLFNKCLRFIKYIAEMGLQPKKNCRAKNYGEVLLFLWW